MSPLVAESGSVALPDHKRRPVLASTTGHVTGSELVARCRELDPTTIPSTVYRTMDVLEDLGLLQPRLLEHLAAHRLGVVARLRGAGEITGVTIDDSLLVSGEGEILADLIVAAHADAKRKLDEANGALMREAAGPMAGMNIPGMPKLF
mgnify:CR=1 FL=1